ncbi:MAG: bifunctional diaminohydroxyphosphoribosylaminopyrimidine deaminase/5-amino-6-(5-phosphoribosylamino)uracil reductase RibD [Chlorobi bacterium]|nr:bifunctional diaminohydroxyphosphoribosylaminopyrimidine deaminase/5-amino-6-(5-phosphoribosylamino)uracil reductase RibD [Chlorobiota bacterium]
MQNNINNDEKYMRRCLQLAENGLGNTYPNPLVGSVIVHNEKIIGEGYHLKAGEAHAEVNAVNSVKNKELLKYSTLYVNLEPCAHKGRTPACSKMIIDLKIPKVVIGCRDSFEKVDGKGIEMMRNAGIEVVVGVLEKESRELNKRFFTFHEKKRPYVILKWAQTLDGFIDFDRKPETPVSPNWITDEYARVNVHKMRSDEQSILVGTNTAEKDNPGLNVRDWAGKNPLRIVIDRNLRLPENLNLFDGKIQTLVFTEKEKANEKNIEYVKTSFGENLPEKILETLYDKDIQSIIVEGGAKTLNSFIEKNLWDEAHIYIGDKFFRKGIKAPVLDFIPEREEKISEAKLFVFRNK